jgi:hypothetical protein
MKISESRNLADFIEILEFKSISLEVLAGT